MNVESRTREGRSAGELSRKKCWGGFFADDVRLACSDDHDRETASEDVAILRCACLVSGANESISPVPFDFDSPSRSSSLSGLPSARIRAWCCAGKRLLSKLSSILVGLGVRSFAVGEDSAFTSTYLGKNHSRNF